MQAFSYVIVLNCKYTVDPTLERADSHMHYSLATGTTWTACDWRAFLKILPE